MSARNGMHGPYKFVLHYNMESYGLRSSGPKAGRYRFESFAIVGGSPLGPAARRQGVLSKEDVQWGVLHVLGQLEAGPSRASDVEHKCHWYKYHDSNIQYSRAVYSIPFIIYAYIHMYVRNFSLVI